MKHTISFGRRNKRTFIILLIVLGCLSAFECSSTRNDLIPLEALVEKDSEEEESEADEEVEVVDVYLDTTPSMAGYLGLKYNNWENQGISK